MMRSPYQSPKDPPSRKFLRLPPREKSKKRRFLLWGAGVVLGYLVYSFVGGDSGLIRIRALQHETAALRARRQVLAVEASRAEQARASTAKDPLLSERVARERFHMVKKDEVLYRYQAEEDSAK
ncbi:MAG: septum formation initiator family protein [Candidatus Eisenbacteria bacterium]|uniref:Septum formation initiator family protein n=1 Tax=Eiseniibacteriota bacterium TaxID=2212470 RepID=A0A538TB43_UNCEI|nr:MAG: septum formation initiator family protein [Candidatus Eisenbacteria bacterium]